MTTEERLAMPAGQMGRVDIRNYIKRRMKEEGVTVYALAKGLGTSYNNLAAGLRGVIPIPLTRVETILWILDGQAPKTNR